MTATQISAEIYRNLGYLADDEGYMNKVLIYLRKLSSQKKKTSAKATAAPEKIVVDMNHPLPTDKYVGLASPKREDDPKAKEEYMRQKYGRYL